jgi:hypothetical protein
LICTFGIFIVGFGMLDLIPDFQVVIMASLCFHISS